MHADEALSRICADAVQGRWLQLAVREDREVEAAIEVDEEDEVSLRLLVRDGQPGRTEVANFRIAQSRAPYVLYEIDRCRTTPAPGGPAPQPRAPRAEDAADVLVGFRAGPSGRSVDVRVALLGGRDDRSAATTAYLRVDPEDWLVPALEGRWVLPIVAMPSCRLVDVIASLSSQPLQQLQQQQQPDVRIVCAQLRPDVRRRVAARSFAQIPSTFSRVYDAAGMVDDEVDEVDDSATAATAAAAAAVAACSSLPDLGAAIEDARRRPATLARHKARHDAIFGELMRRAWAPDRVRRHLEYHMGDEGFLSG